MVGALSELAIAHTGVVLLLVPADPLRPSRADEHFAPEAAAARDAGHDVVLIDHDALAEPDGAEQAVARVPDGGGGVPRLDAEQPIHCPALCIPLTLARAGNNVVLG